MTLGQKNTLLFLKKYNKDLTEAVKDSDIFLATIVAQKCWESGFGTSPKAVNYNNFGGIKGRPKYSTGKTSNGWAIFPNARACFDSYVYFISNLQIGNAPGNLKLRYQAALDAQSPEDQIYWLVYYGYCSTPEGLSNDARAKLYLNSVRSFINILNQKGIGGKVTSQNISIYSQNINTAV